MSKQLMTHTQLAFILSINIVTQDNNDFHFLTIPLVRLTTIIFVIWSIRQAVTRQWQTIKTLSQTIIQAALDFCEGFYLLIETGRKPWQKTLVENAAIAYGGVL